MADSNNEVVKQWYINAGWESNCTKYKFMELAEYRQLLSEGQWSQFFKHAVECGGKYCSTHTH
jgi:hypothetical protein